MIVRYLVTITCDTVEQAETVIAERIDYDEDYGFEYTIMDCFWDKEEDEDDRT